MLKITYVLGKQLGNGPSKKSLFLCWEWHFAWEQDWDAIMLVPEPHDLSQCVSVASRKFFPGEGYYEFFNFCGWTICFGKHDRECYWVQDSHWGEEKVNTSHIAKKTGWENDRRTEWQENRVTRGWKIWSRATHICQEPDWERHWLFLVAWLPCWYTHLTCQDIWSAFKVNS